MKHFTKIISTGGGAKRIDPTKIEYKSIWETYNDKFIKYNIQTGEVEWNYRSYAAPYSESGINRDSFVVQPNVFRAYKIKVINRSLNVSYNIGIKDLQVN